MIHKLASSLFELLWCCNSQRSKIKHLKSERNRKCCTISKIFQPLEQLKLQQCLRRMDSTGERQQPIFILQIKAAHRDRYFTLKKNCWLCCLQWCNSFCVANRRGLWSLIQAIQGNIKNLSSVYVQVSKHTLLGKIHLSQKGYQLTEWQAWGEVASAYETKCSFQFLQQGT